MIADHYRVFVCCIGSGSLAAMAIFEGGWKQNMKVSKKYFADIFVFLWLFSTSVESAPENRTLSVRYVGNLRACEQALSQCL